MTKLKSQNHVVVHLELRQPNRHLQIQNHQLDWLHRDRHGQRAQHGHHLRSKKLKKTIMKILKIPSKFYKLLRNRFFNFGTNSISVFKEIRFRENDCLKIERLDD